jgi:hypothetical protein
MVLHVLVLRDITANDVENIANTMNDVPSVNDVPFVEQISIPELIAEPTPESTQEPAAASPVMPTMPTVAEDSTVQMEETEDEQQQEEPINIDTVGLAVPRGNWYFKKTWLDRAEQQCNKIITAVEEINELRLLFFVKRTELDKKVLMPFFVDIGFSQGELLGTLSLLLEHLERERAKDGMLDDQERTLLESVKKNRDLLEQLRRDTQAISVQENAANELLEQVMDKNNLVVKYAREARAHKREIGHILDDKKARELYYKIDADWRNIKNIHRYLEHDLQRYFDQLITDMQGQVERIKGALQELKEKGIDLKYAVEQHEEHHTLEAEERAPHEQAPVAKKQAPKGIMAIMSSFFSKVISWVTHVLLWLPRTLWGFIRRKV